MTAGEKHTAATAERVLKMLTADDRTAVEAWVEDRERAACSRATVRVAVVEGGKTLGLAIGVFVPIALLAFFWFVRDCPECPACEECLAAGEAEKIDWSRLTDEIHYSVADSYRCVSIGDAVLCAPARVPAEMHPAAGGAP